MIYSTVTDVEVGTPNKKKVEAEPTLPIYLKFTDLTYKAIVKGVTTIEEKTILHRITGVVKPGEMLALMGPSGSGKTTLLSILGGRLSLPIVGGAVTYNDQPFSKLDKATKGRTSYGCHPSAGAGEYLERLDHLMKLYKIKKFTKHRCQDTMVGGSMVRGVSGGERKRVCIGSEILFNHALLFLDEPSSGLDSTTSLKIIQMLHDLAKAGKTIITAIDQPSGRLFYKFDKLILLGKGNLLHSGKTSEVMGYFGSIGFSPLIAMNRAEFLVDVANGNINDTTLPSALESKMQIQGNPNPGSKHGKSSSVIIHEYLVEAYESTVEAKERKKLMAPISKDKKSKLCSVKRERGASWWQQYSILFQRAFKEQRHEYLSWLKISQVLAIAIILEFLWWQSGCKTEKELEDQAGLLFFIAFFWGFFPLSTATFTFPQEKAMLIKE
ncbi:hypothetical protein Cgig2_021621 [Carnegiea gigantea]|uniref:ABC transporter domain-containing protein n=1 Tax=Carnegiea gigantea TaxID=171969 RepID=A0A9Q1GPT2_9CARY|nr:hypothetical protein Cgig2_021621 [Carnegiea gigantea]